MSEIKSTPAQLKAMTKYRMANLEKTRACKRAYYQANKEQIKEKHKKKYAEVKKQRGEQDDAHSRNFGILKSKLKTMTNMNNPFEAWQMYHGDFDKTNAPLRDGTPMKLLNKTTNGTCSHCLCGHRTGKMKPIIIASSDVSDNSTPVDLAEKQAYEEHKEEIKERAMNSLTKSYEEASLLPMVQLTGHTYILVGKACANYFGLSKEQISEAFKKNKNKINPPKFVKEAPTKYMSDSYVLGEKFDAGKQLAFGKYKGLHIERVYEKKGGDMYLEWVERVCDLPDELRGSILDLLAENSNR